LASTDSPNPFAGMKSIFGIFGVEKG
jgi:hypothetical protein